MTEKQLSDELGITKAAVGYHLQRLLNARLIRLVKLEAEKHGILQKYYAPTAVLFIVDIDVIARNIKRVFIEEQKKYLRGLFANLGGHYVICELSSEKLEKLAEMFLKQLKKIARKHLSDVSPKNTELFRGKLYREAVAELSNQEEWHRLFQQ